MHLFDKRPPFVRFEEQEYGTNQEASLAAGRPVPRVVVMACITPNGSKDEVVKPAEEWLKNKRADAVNGTWPYEWADRFERQYAEYLKGNELPREGTPIKTWQMTNREQSRRLIALNITTVEDLANVPDNALSGLGLDGRYLRDMAKTWIAEAKSLGSSAKEIADLKVALSDKDATIERLAERVAALEAASEKRGPGRPRKDEAA